MNKKNISVFVSIFLLLNMISGISFAEKKDVGDPVLQEIISELSNKMPRFINKYGTTIFVADEQITRGALLQALYEYDKKMSSKNVSETSISSVGVISKKDYDALNTRVVALEKKSQNLASTNTSSNTKSTDFVQIMNDLELNMPMLLDNTLSSSKVFKELEKKVNSKTTVVAGAVSGSSTSDGSNASLVNLQKNVMDLTTKVNNVELSLASVNKSAGKTGSSETNAQVIYEVKNFKKEIENVNKKVSDIELKLADAKNISSVSSSPSKEEINNLKKTIVQMQQSYVSLGKRLDSIEREQNSYIASASNSSNSAGLSTSQLRIINSKINSIKEDVDNIKIDTSRTSKNNNSTADIKKIEKRLSNLEKTEKSLSSKSESGSSKTSTIAKVSLGLSLVAALFIAR